jgi:hypothetical protein
MLMFFRTGVYPCQELRGKGYNMWPYLTMLNCWCQTFDQNDVHNIFPPPEEKWHSLEHPIANKDTRTMSKLIAPPFFLSIRRYHFFQKWIKINLTYTQPFPFKFHPTKITNLDNKSHYARYSKCSGKLLNQAYLSWLFC